MKNNVSFWLRKQWLGAEPPTTQLFLGTNEGFTIVAAEFRPWTLGTAALARAPAQPSPKSRVRAGERGGAAAKAGGNWDEDDGCGCGESRPEGAGAKVGAEAGAEPALQARGWRRAGQGRPRSQEAQGREAGKGRELAQEGNRRPTNICLYNNYITTI